MNPADYIILGLTAIVAFLALVAVICISTNEILAKQAAGFASLNHNLQETEKKIMATQAEVVVVLTQARDSLKQVNIDVADASVKLGELKNKITELEAAIANGVVGQELADIAAEVKTLAGQADEALPNPVVVPPNP